MKLTDKLFGTHSSHEIKRINPIVDKIESYQSEMHTLSDEQLRSKTIEFKNRLSQGETLDQLLPEAYAVVREAAKRVLGMEHFGVQLIGGVVLHQGRIAEMRTGEGKTLVATLPAYLNALEGKGVHVVTVNDYLAKRDAEQMGEVHKFLGLTVGVVLSNMDRQSRKAAYSCDITYITNNELGFDYLRDNMCISRFDLVQRDLNYCIIDEVDSVFIDEARTPLIISGPSGKPTNIYDACDALACMMERGEDAHELSKIDILTGTEYTETGDFVVDEKDKLVTLTAAGVEKTERFFGLKNLADPENLEIQHCIILALRAHNLMFRDRDYVVSPKGEVLIVDTFTGRIMPGRRYSDGLHQAIEAKEHVKIQQETVTMASITFQSFFNKYKKVSGMTGTALTEEKEFRDIYSLDVVSIPTNRPVQRIDHEDAVYKTKAEKYKAIVEEVRKSHEKGQPVLVGTIDIDVSELLSKMLNKAGIRHNVLNAKYHEKEAEIIAEAGRHGAVTIATNMAGRGTDIKLDEEARAAGGLKIIGTERHESRRIDNQLRGRAGRQGDVGETQFFISLEDNLMRLFGSEKLLATFNALGVQDGQSLEHKLLSATIEKAQTRIEANNFASRKSLLDYDKISNEQRELVYKQRNRVLTGDDIHDQILGMIKREVSDCVDSTIGNSDKSREWDIPALTAKLHPIIPIPKMNEIPYDKFKGREDLKDKLSRVAFKLYEFKEKEFEKPEHLREYEKFVLLKIIDRKWMAHLSDMENLKQSMSLQAYGHKNPVDEYKFASYDMMDKMNQSIIDDTLTVLFHCNVETRVNAA